MVLVFGQGVRDIGVGVLAKSNKTATFINTGKYGLSFAVVQKSSLGCLHPDTLFSLNSTEPR